MSVLRAEHSLTGCARHPSLDLPAAIRLGGHHKRVAGRRLPGGRGGRALQPGPELVARGCRWVGDRGPPARSALVVVQASMRWGENGSTSGKQPELYRQRKLLLVDVGPT
jgi:hypothetical protein